MIYVLVVALILQPVAFIIHLDRLTSRANKVTADLCQRLQAPETAVVQHVVGDTYVPSHLPFDDDGAYLKYVEDMTRPITSNDLNG